MCPQLVAVKVEQYDIQKFFKDVSFTISYLEIQFCHAFMIGSAQLKDTRVMFSGNNFK